MRLALFLIMSLVQLAAPELSSAGPGAARAPLDPAFERARAAADARDWDTALRLADSLTTAAPQEVDFALFRARCLGWADRNAASAEAFEDLFASHPELYEPQGSELAQQLTWAGRYDEAIAVYDRLLRSRPADIGLLRGRALALSWKGDAAGAAKAYAMVLGLAPDDAEARLQFARNLLWSDRPADAERFLTGIPSDHVSGEERLLLGRLASWRDRHREAIGHYDLILSGVPAAESPDLIDRVTIEKARALYWMGRAGDAVRLLDARFAGRTVPDADRLRVEITVAESRPWISAMYRASEDSDDLTIQTTDVSAGWSPSINSMLGASVRIDRFDLEDVSLDVQRFGLLGRLRSGDARLAFHFRLGDVDEIGFNPVTGNASIEWSPADRFILGLSYERVDYESIRALQREIIGQFLSGSVAFRPGPCCNGMLGAGVGSVDGPGHGPRNERFHANGDLDYLVLRRPRLSLTGGFYHFAFSELTADGYYNPERYTIGLVGLDFNPVIQALRCELVLAGRAGWQYEEPGERTNAGSFTGRIIFHPLTGWSLEYRYDTSDSKVASERGYSRTRHAAFLSAKF